MRLIFVCVLAGCADDPAPPVDLDPLAALQRDTGVPWTVRWQPDIPTVAFIEGRTPPLARDGPDGERAGRSFIRRYAALFGDPDDLDSEWALSDELGMTHVAFRQRQGRIPIW